MNTSTNKTKRKKHLRGTNEKQMSKWEGIVIPVVSADNFTETDFEERYVYYAQKFGYAGKELESRTRLTEDYFYDPVVKASKKVIKQRNVEVPCLDANSNPMVDGNGHPIMETIQVDYTDNELLKEIDPERYKVKLRSAEREYQAYIRNKRELCNDLMLHLDKSLRAAVTQHPDYAAGKLNDDVITLWDIVIECATGKGAQGVYLVMTRFLNLRQKSGNPADFFEYVREYNEAVKLITRLCSPDQVLEMLFNAKFIDGLNPEQFQDQLKTIMCQQTWPDYKSLQNQLMIQSTIG